MPFPPYPSVPAPSTWTAGELVTAPQLRSDVANAAAFLANRPLFAGQCTVAEAIPNSTNVSIGLTADIVDTWNGHLTSPTGFANTVYYCQAPGWYLCTVSAPYAYTGAQSAFDAGFTGVTAGTIFGPVIGPIQLTGSGFNPQPVACDLIEQTVTGAIGGTGDNIQGTTAQFTGVSQELQNLSYLLPDVTVRWVAAVTGTTGLPVPSNPAFPSPPTALGHAFMNTSIRDTIRFLTYPPVCKLYYTAGTTTIPSQGFPSGTVVPLNTVTVDNYGGATTGTGTGYTAPVAGNYFAYNQVNFAGTAATSVGYSAGLQVNSGTITWGDSVFQHTSSAATGAGVQIRRRVRLNAGDFIQPVVQQSSTAALALNTTASLQTRFIVVWDGA